MTAHDLRTALGKIGIDVSVEGVELVLEGPDTPVEAEGVLDLLRAPLVAITTGRKLYCFLDGGVPHGKGGVLSPRDLLPWETRLLSVEGGEWTRISPFAREAMPDCFEANPATKRKAVRK